jgi:diguanylate cyclase
VVRAVTTASAGALDFLSRHRLPPTPQNYTLAYIAVDEPTSRIGLAVKAIAEDGVRMRQEEADEIVELYAGDSIRHSAMAADAEHRRLEAQAERLGELTETAVAQSYEFAADLDSQVKQLDSEAARTVQIVARMIERSKQAEDNFRSALREIETLRQELAAARGDAERDTLTGLPNRRSVERQLEELATAGRSRTIGLCDVDSFKRVNDRFGHTVGDRVLKMVASSLAASCAPHLVGRWGGEEFIIVMETDDPAACMALLDQARADLAARRFKLRETDEPLGVISFSAGVATGDGDASNTPGVLHRADAAMYAAKQAGRNQVMLG